MTTSGQLGTGQQVESPEAVAASVRAVCEQRIDAVERALRTTSASQPG